MFAEPLAAFFNAETGFAVQAQATTRFGEVVSFAVIFDNGYAGALGGLADATQPSAQARTVDVAELVQGCAVCIDGADWQVTDLQPDGTGMSTLLLRKP